MQLPKIKDKKGRVIDPRKWQKSAFAETVDRVNDGGTSYLANVCPGGGKTKYGVMLAKHLLGAGIVSRVLIVSPRGKIRQQWTDDMTLNAILTREDITSKRAESRVDALPDRGLSMTYQMLSVPAVCSYIEGICHRYQTLVIMDEIHWGGERDGFGNKWGRQLVKATSAARFCLALSGTPFREDHYRIPYLSYVDGVGSADFDYSYGQALRDGVVTPIYFRERTGRLKFSRVNRSTGELEDEEELDFEDGTYHTPTGEIDKEKMNRRLSAALHPTSGYWRDLMDDAITRLEWLRNNRQRNAGGIVFAATQEHARSIAAYIAQQTGRQPHVIISDESSDIDGYASSSDAWVVSVQMISEGVDIERLRLCVMLTNITTKKNFMQSVARCIRIDYESNGDDAWTQEAYVYMPPDPRFQEYALQFKDAVSDQEVEPPGGPGPGPGPSPRKEYSVDESETDEGGVIFGDEYWTAEEIRAQTAEIEKRVDKEVLEKLGAVMTEEMRHIFAEQLMRDQRKSGTKDA